MTAIYGQTARGDSVTIGPVPDRWRLEHPEARTAAYQVQFNGKPITTGGRGICVRVFKLLTEPETARLNVTADWPAPAWAAS